MTIQYTDISKLESIDGKPILEISEHTTKYFKDRNDPKFFTFVESDTRKQEELVKNDIFVDQTDVGIKIQAGFHAGIREFDKFIIKVVPKSVGGFENLGRMITFCYLDKISFFDLEEIRFQSKHDHPLDLLIPAFTQLCQKLITKGLYRTYVTTTDNIPYLKGKLLLKQQIQNTMKFNMKFSCEYDEFTANNLENQIILYTLKKCLIITDNSNLKTKILKLIHHITRQVEDQQISLSDFQKIHYTRLNKDYKNPLIIAKKILENIGVLNLNEMKDKLIFSFFEPMPDLFEEFLAKLFEYSTYKLEHPNITYPWKENGKDSNMNIQPDLVLYQDKLFDNSKTRYDKDFLIRENVKFVMDAKYMEELKPHERYQIAFYLHEYEMKNGFALLPTLESTFSKDENDHMVYKDDKKQLLEVPSQEISINIRHINVDQLLSVLYSRKSQKEIESEILSILEQITA